MGFLLFFVFFFDEKGNDIIYNYLNCSDNNYRKDSGRFCFFIVIVCYFELF